jgi:hypothetical protein
LEALHCWQLLLLLLLLLLLWCKARTLAGYQRL